MNSKLANTWFDFLSTESVGCVVEGKNFQGISLSVDVAIL